MSTARVTLPAVATTPNLGGTALPSLPAFTTQAGMVRPLPVAAVDAKLALNPDYKPAKYECKTDCKQTEPAMMRKDCWVPVKDPCDPCAPKDPCAKSYSSGGMGWGWFWGWLIMFIIIWIIFFFVFWLTKPPAVQNKTATGQPNGTINWGMVWLWSFGAALLLSIIIGIIGAIARAAQK